MDKYEITMTILIALFALPFLYLLFFIGRMVHFAIKERYRQKIVARDPVFGEIEYYDGYWSSLVLNPFAVSIAAGTNGPTEVQRQLYLSVRDNLENHISEAKRYLRENDDTVDFPEYELYAISIGNEEETAAGRFSLELGYGNFDMVYDVCFERDRAISCIASD